MEDAFRFADQLGPEKIVHVCEPRAGLRAIVVVDNTAAGPAIGGNRLPIAALLVRCRGRTPTAPAVSGRVADPSTVD